jgi:hypothetical protein
LGTVISNRTGKEDLGACRVVWDGEVESSSKTIFLRGVEILQRLNEDAVVKLILGLHSVNVVGVIRDRELEHIARAGRLLSLVSL